MALPPENEITGDTSMTVVLFVFSTLISGPVPPYFLTPVLHVSPQIVAGASAIAFTEFLWRDRVRPRLRWNSAGVQLVWSVRMRTVRWLEIDRLENDFNQLRFQCGHESLTWEYDAFVIASYLSRRYRDRNSCRVGALLTARLAAKATVDDPPQGVPRRPLLLYILCAVAAIGESIVLL